MINAFHFLRAIDYDHTVLPPEQTLAQVLVKFQRNNAPFLAGIKPEPDHCHRQFFTIEELERAREGVTLSEDNAQKVMGDLSAALPAGWRVIIADGTDCAEEARMAASLGYRPARPGEFIQVLWVIRGMLPLALGNFFCWEGRQPNYAILASISHDGHVSATFDTHYDDLSNMSGANMDTKCVFVKE